MQDCKINIQRSNSKEEKDRKIQMIADIVEDWPLLRFEIEKNLDTSLFGLVKRFFYDGFQNATRYVNSGLHHCYDNKRRSPHDFYSLQKHYLGDKALTFAQCAEIYFDLPRGGETYMKYTKKATSETSWERMKHEYESVVRERPYYYCTTVLRNVFCTLTNVTEEEFKQLELKLKQYEKHDSTIPVQTAGPMVPENTEVPA